jgi:hypothetical protein
MRPKKKLDIIINHRYQGIGAIVICVVGVLFPFIFFSLFLYRHNRPIELKAFYMT